MAILPRQRSPRKPPRYDPYGSNCEAIDADGNDQFLPSATDDDSADDGDDWPLPAGPDDDAGDDLSFPNEAAINAGEEANCPPPRLKPRTPPPPSPLLPRRASTKRRPPAEGYDHAAAELFRTRLWPALYDGQGPRNATYVPGWVRRITGSEAQAFLLSEILYWQSEDKSIARINEAARCAVKVPRPRNKGYTSSGEMGLITTVRQLAISTMLSPGTIGGVATVNTKHPGALDSLRFENLIRVDFENGKRFLRVDPCGLAQRLGADKHVNAEVRSAASSEYITSGASQPRWDLSATARLAMKDGGITAHFGLMSAIEQNLRPARPKINKHLLLRALSQIVNRFGKGKTIERWGFQWRWMSVATFAIELGVAPSSAERALERLVKLSLVYRTSGVVNHRLHTFVAPHVANIVKHMKENPDEL